MVHTKVTKILAALALGAATSAHAFMPSDANETTAAFWAKDRGAADSREVRSSVFPSSVSESAPSGGVYGNARDGGAEQSAESAASGGVEQGRSSGE